MRHKPIIVILALCLLLPTAMSAQKVTGDFSSTTLGAVLDEVEARTGYHFIFDSNEINGHSGDGILQGRFDHFCVGQDSWADDALFHQREVRHNLKGPEFRCP